MNIPLIIVAIIATVPILYLIFKTGKNDEHLDSVKKGSITLFAESSCTDLMNALVKAFMARNPEAIIVVKTGNDKEAFEALLNDTARLVIMPRGLSQKEEQIFRARYFVPKMTLFAKEQDGTKNFILFNNQARIGLGSAFSNFVTGAESNQLIKQLGLTPIAAKHNKKLV